MRLLAPHALLMRKWRISAASNNKTIGSPLPARVVRALIYGTGVHP
jgi:hypothetical protein